MSKGPSYTHKGLGDSKFIPTKIKSSPYSNSNTLNKTGSPKDKVIEVQGYLISKGFKLSPITVSSNIVLTPLDLIRSGDTTVLYGIEDLGSYIVDLGNMQFCNIVESYSPVNQIKCSMSVQISLPFYGINARKEYNVSQLYKPPSWPSSADYETYELTLAVAKNVRKDLLGLVERDAAKFFRSTDVVPGFGISTHKGNHLIIV